MLYYIAVPEWVLGLLSFIGLTTLWRIFERVGSWLKPQGVVRDRPLTLQIGETAFIASHPYTDGQKVKDIICQAILGNPNDKPKTVTTFRLKVRSKAPYPLSEARDSGRGTGSCPLL